jgi:hypothetical protein
MVRRDWQAGSTSRQLALADGAVLGVGNEADHGEVWMVPVQGANAGARDQGLSMLEAAVEDRVGGGTEGDRKGEEPL